MKDLLKQAADTIQRLGAAAQDCKSCARLPICNAYRTENRFEGCDYKWVHEDEATDVQTVKRGHWIKETFDYSRCSICGEIRKPSNFCPECGADMRQEESNGKTN